MAKNKTLRAFSSAYTDAAKTHWKHDRRFI